MRSQTSAPAGTRSSATSRAVVHTAIVLATQSAPDGLAGAARLVSQLLELGVPSVHLLARRPLGLDDARVQLHLSGGRVEDLRIVAGLGREAAGGGGAGGGRGG